MSRVMLESAPVTVGNIFCIGRNYAAHAAELGNAVEPEPLVFLKPTSAIALENQPVTLPAFSHEVHHEGELVVLIGKGGTDISEAEALAHVAGYGVGLDLTARDVQADAKARGLPWTKAKGFRGAACVSAFVSAMQVRSPQALHFSLSVNGQVRQQGDTSLMLFPVARIISTLSSVYGLSEGDLIFTGTPEGVAALAPGDTVEMVLEQWVTARWQVAA